MYGFYPSFVPGGTPDPSLGSDPQTDSPENSGKQEGYNDMQRIFPIKEIM